MALTFESNYKEVFSKDTVEIIESLKENYELQDILEVLDVLGDDWTETQLEDILNVEDKDSLYDFLEVYGNSSLEYYEQFVALCDDYDEDAVRAYADHVGIMCLAGFDEAYSGEFSTVREFVEDVMESMGTEIPSWLCVDYQQTWDYSLRHDYFEENGYYFRHI